MNIGRNASLLIGVSLLLTVGSALYLYANWERDQPKGPGFDAPVEVREFFRAASRGDTDILIRMLDANPSLAKEVIPGRGTALHRAAAQNRIEIIKILVNHGADLNARGIWGGSPLHVAAWLGQKEAVRLLIARGANVEGRCTDFDSTPLLWAAYGSTYNHNPDGDYIGTCRALLDSGAKVDTYNREGIAAVSFADEDLADFLMEHGAKPPTTQSAPMTRPPVEEERYEAVPPGPSA